MNIAQGVTISINYNKSTNVIFLHGQQVSLIISEESIRQLSLSLSDLCAI